MQIRLILDIYSSKTDTFGNRYHLARLASTRTGKFVWFRAHSEGNARFAVTAAGKVPSESVHINEQTLPIREFNRLEKQASRILNESDISTSVLAELEG